MRKWGNKTTESLETSKLMFHYRKRQNFTSSWDVLQSFQINISASRKVAQHMNDKTISIISANFAESYHFASHYSYSSKFFYYFLAFPCFLTPKQRFLLWLILFWLRSPIEKTSDDEQWKFYDLDWVHLLVLDFED